jgi:hypothetical protein
MDIINKTNYFYKMAQATNDPRLSEISKLNSFNAKIKFCTENFKRLASGSSRVIFEYNQDLVIKLAKNQKGIEQNAIENDGFIQSNHNSIVTNVIDSDPNDIWLLVQRAMKISPSKFKQLTGIDFKLFGEYIMFKLSNKPISQIPEYLKILKDNEFIEDVLELMVNFNMPPGDITRISSWGEVNGKAVLTDYGLTQDIYSTYYKR